MKQYLKSYSLFVVAVIAAILASCKTNEPDVDNPNAIVIDISTTQADKAQAELLNYQGDLIGVMATANYENGKFVLNLPAEVDVTNLSLASQSVFDPRITVSNPQARLGGLQISAYKGNIFVGYFVMAEVGQSSSKEQTFVYADRDVNVLGDYQDEILEGLVFRQIYEMHLKKGWNKVYAIQSNTFTGAGIQSTVRMTTSAQAGLRWMIVNGN